MATVFATPDTQDEPGSVQRSRLEELLESPPETCRRVAELWKQSLSAASQSPLSTRELFSYWIGRSLLHDVERRNLNEVYGELDARALKALADAVHDLREDPGTVESYVDALRKAEIEAR